MIMENSPNVTLVRNSELNQFISSNKVLIEKESEGLDTDTTIVPDLGVYIIDIKVKDADAIKSMFESYRKAGHLYPVTKSGLKFNEQCAEIGSYRFCTNSEELALFLDRIISSSNAFPEIYRSEKGDAFRYSGVSPYFRFMRYEPGGLHFPHYDSDYVFSKPYAHYQTKFSLVMYFSDCESGDLAFVNDSTHHAEDGSDWDRQANPDEIAYQIWPRIGRIVLFPHNLCHSVLELDRADKERIMVRGDLIFEAV